MSNLWCKRGSDWRLRKLEEFVRVEETPAENCDIAFLCAAQGSPPPWVFIASHGVSARINGEALVLGIRVLRDRDFVRVGDGTGMFFSSESPAQVRPHVAGSRRTNCRRCGGEIKAGDLTVTCPKCGGIYHQDGDLTCWTYEPACNQCGRATALDAAYSWTPEDL